MKVLTYFSEKQAFTIPTLAIISEKWFPATCFFINKRLCPCSLGYGHVVLVLAAIATVKFELIKIQRPLADLP